MAGFLRFRPALFALLAALTLGACGAPNPAGAPESQEAAAQAPLLPDGATQPAFVREHIRLQNPYWVNLLQQGDGGVIQHAPQTIFRYPDGTAEIWIQILHAGPLRESFEDDATIEEITFQRERYRYLFRCARREFTVTERRIMGSGEAIARTVLYEAEGEEPQWRPVADGGPGAFLIGPACEAQ